LELFCALRQLADKVALYASQPNPLEFAESFTGYDLYRFRVGDYQMAFQIGPNAGFLESMRRARATRRGGDVKIEIKGKLIRKLERN